MAQTALEESDEMDTLSVRGLCLHALDVFSCRLSQRISMASARDHEINTLVSGIGA